jgi:alkylation response protein AidB-like acyl-CoA dehydrogenase
MDFSLTEAQQELSELTARILGDKMTLAHLKERDNSEDWYDLDAWRELAKANILGIAIPEAHGGLGLGLLDLCLVLREVGRTVAPVPAVPTLVSGAMTIARFGSDEQQAVLSGVASGDVLLTAALSEYESTPDDPHTTAKRDGDEWRIDGVKTAVPGMHAAETVLVPCRTDDGVVVLLAPTGAAGITATRQTTTNHEPIFEVHFDGVRVGDAARLAGDDVLEWMLARTTIALCAVASGAADKALHITAEYTTQRKQFDRVIGTFQAVGQRLADAYIDNQAMELTMLQAATHLDEGREVPAEVATAKFWAADGGNRVGHAALHVHGGISIDVDYSIHRYFLWLKQIEFTLGAATPQLVALGKILADTPA